MTEHDDPSLRKLVNRLSFVVVLLLFMAHAGIADDDYGAARALVKSGKILSLEQILGTLDQDNRGRILEVEFEREDGRYIYEIEILYGSGIVRELEIDAKSGELLTIERED